MKKRTSLERDFPDIAKLFHPTKNGETRPSDVTSHNGNKFYWLCPKGILNVHEWISTVNNMVRTKSSFGCPFCSGKQVCLDNCLAIKRPDLEKQWHPLLNGNLTPYDITCGSRQSVAWLCPNGQKEPHIWYAPVNRRNHGSNCPFCQGQKFHADNCLANLRPDIAEQWDYSVNGLLTPHAVTLGSSKKVGWKCSVCNHQWFAQINHRTDKKHGSDCPRCYQRTSRPEIFYYCQFKHIFPDTINCAVIKDIEIDIYIPSIKIAIEYDGYPWHLYKEKSDRKKNEEMAKIGITLFRIRDNRLDPLSDFDIMIDGEFRQINFSKTIIIFRKIKDFLDRNGITNLQLTNYLTLEDFPENAIETYNLLEKELCLRRPKNNIQITRPNQALLWNQEKNGNLTPQNVSPGSHKLVYWQCPICKYEWQERVSNICRGFECPICLPRNKRRNSPVATTHPDLISQSWAYDLNPKDNPCNLTAGSNKIVWWRCPNDGHIWEAKIRSRVREGKKCPVCTPRRNRPSFRSRIKPQTSALDNFTVDAKLPSQ